MKSQSLHTTWMQRLSFNVKTKRRFLKCCLNMGQVQFSERDRERERKGEGEREISMMRVIYWLPPAHTH